MASKQEHQEQGLDGVQLDSDQFCCSVCLDLFKEPVTIYCGHSYCRRCIESYWNKEEKKSEYSCPQCREIFSPRPVLKKNNILEEVVEKLKRRSPQPPPAPLTCDSPSDMICDFCGPTRNKATKSCLTCLASYCDAHIQPHYSVPVLQKHELVSATIPLPEKLCKQHNKLMELYCCVDKQLICTMCTVDEHKSHQFEAVSELKDKTKKNLVLVQRRIQEKVQQREKDLKELLQAEEDLKSCTQTSLHDCGKIFAELVSSLQIGCSEVEQLIKAQEEAAIAQAEEMQLQLEEELEKLRRRDADLQQLLSSEELVYLMQSLSTLDDSEDFTPSVGLLRSFSGVTICVSHLRGKIETMLKETLPKISAIVSYVDFSLPPPPKTREQFLQYCRPLTLDETTNYPHLHLIDNNHRVRPSPSQYAAHPSRFLKFPQVLCREGLTERCYWEVEWHARTLSAAVAYKDTNRTSDESQFGKNDKSWSLECTETGCLFRHNNVDVMVPDACSKKIGVFLDYKAGILSFYHISDPMVLIFEVRTAFTQPLYPGLGLNYEWYDIGVFAQLVKLW
ncbi:E3 ubiquitin/ISG15 ligase TRIM25-like [Melanotaenia boesemani]|uniref:E3 ubiquitin/ISG15 ligase TRIM25-like n=1 Tax=Melanotaenia boesemani TaxID=1250792 RepID=UPI001C057AB5|nr:E3 ubiquitin/ISG15 ligase TRIM25-like [Melanotaenia boesemani]